MAGPPVEAMEVDEGLPGHDESVARRAGAPAADAHGTPIAAGVDGHARGERPPRRRGAPEKECEREHGTERDAAPHSGQILTHDLVAVDARGSVLWSTVPDRARRVLPGLAVLWALGLAALAVTLERPGSLFVNLGAGDSPFVRGFRADWERDGLTGAGETMFHWTEDGARLELPLAVSSGRLWARLRLARFAAGPAEIALESGGREVDRWTQEPRGWRVREVDLGEVRGPLAIGFRSHAPDGDALGIALDWVEITGARRIRPARGILLRLLVLLFAVPVAAGLVLRRPAMGTALGAALGWLATLAVTLDRLGGLCALAAASMPLLVAVVVVSLALRLLARFWPDIVDWRAAPAALLGASLGLVGVFQPFYHYPDVDTHVRMLQAMKANPLLIVDPTQPWARRGDVTREIAGRRIAIPYAVEFHALAWPLAPVLGDAPALKTVAVSCLGITLLLVHALTRASGQGTGTAVLAQAFFATIPVTASRLTLALYPTLLGQLALVALLVHLARRLGRLDGARDGAAATLFLVAANAVYTGTIVMIAALVIALAAAELLAGEWQRALRLLGAWAIATALVGLMYLGFVPVLVRDVLPHLGAGGAPTGAPAGPGPLRLAVGRASLFFDAIYPALLVPGLVALRAAPRHARRVVSTALVVGAVVLVLRYVWTAALRDAKEVELLAAPVSLLASAGVAFLWRRAMPGRAAAVVASALALGWGLARSAALYGERFLAAGR